jgi:4-alpha-glucanotransferase
MRTDRWGIDPGYQDCDRRWRPASEETRRAIRKAMRVEEAARPPAARVRVVRPGESAGLRGPGELLLEDGRTIAVDAALPAHLPFGYHDFQPRRGKPVRLILTPGACYLPEDLRVWGWSAQLYALRSAESWGIGDLEDLRRLAEWSAALGAGVIMINPLGASSPGIPQQPSPYFPGSRRYRNPIYLRIPEAPGVEARALNARRLIDRDRVFQLKMQALARQWQSFGGDPGFDEYCREQGEPLREFATFCALSEEFRAGWRCWPADYRHPRSPEVRRFAGEHAAKVRFQQWLQWLIDRQLARCSEHLTIMQDLPVGVDPDGADAWIWQDVLADGATFGAPPDPFAAEGQAWGLPPFIPHMLRAVRYEPFIQTIRAAMRHAGALRVDHVMGLFRLFWIPQGASAAQGAYVRYPADDLLGILALESHRARAFVVGEDLGTVEDGVREKLAAHNILSSRVLWFEADPPARYPRRAMASITTHDLPTIAGLWSGSDVREQRKAGLHANAEGALAIRARLRELTGLGDDASPREVIVRAHELLAEAPSMVLAAALDDALAVEERPNMPSTRAERPNWSLALPETLEELEADPLPRAVAAALNAGARSRSPGWLDPAQVVAAYRRAARRCLILDYDGTLAPYAGLPAQAVPEPSLLALLERLSADPANRVALISGRRAEDLERWFGHLGGLILAAEHGARLRLPGSPEWRPLRPPPAGWKDTVRPALEPCVDRVPGSFVEEKEYALVWHYRLADPELGERMAGDLMAILHSRLAPTELRAYPGRKSVEVKPVWANKGAILERLPDFCRAADFRFAAGDDRTDEDLFAALDAQAWTVRVGPGETRARFRVPDVAAVISLLERFAHG